MTSSSAQPAATTATFQAFTVYACSVFSLVPPFARVVRTHLVYRVSRVYNHSLVQFYRMLVLCVLIRSVLSFARAVRTHPLYRLLVLCVLTRSIVCSCCAYSPTPSYARAVRTHPLYRVVGLVAPIQRAVGVVEGEPSRRADVIERHDQLHVIAVEAAALDALDPARLRPVKEPSGTGNWASTCVSLTSYTHHTRTVQVQVHALEHENNTK